MLSVRGIFDGIKLRLFERVDIKEPQEVVVVFLNDKNSSNSQRENEISGKEIQHYINENKAFDFLKNDDEDIYTDDNLKIKY